MTDDQIDITGDNVTVMNPLIIMLISIIFTSGNYLALFTKNSSTGEVFSELLKVYCINGYDVITIKPKDYDESVDYEILDLVLQKIKRVLQRKIKIHYFPIQGREHVV